VYGPCHQHVLSFIEHNRELTDAIGAEAEEHAQAKQGSESRHRPGLLQRAQRKGVMSLWNEPPKDAVHDNNEFGGGWTLVRSHRHTGHLIARREVGAESGLWPPRRGVHGRK
jgi:hypothetical protein